MMAENYMVKQGMIQPLTAYHGTPHTIQGQFDINKVGTGEGAQAYGHGMYFAENPTVAEGYRHMLSADRNVASENIKFATLQKYAPKETAAVQAEIDGFINGTGGYNDFVRIVNEQGSKSLKNALLKEEPNLFSAGNLYKVDIPDADIPMMLDWDLPISQQPKSVQKAFQSIMQKDVSPEGMDIGGAKILDNRNRQADPTQAQPWVMKSGDTMFGLTQKDVDQLISNETAKGLYGKLAADLGSQRAASEYLQSQGVKGIRYLDQGSRGKSGTSNFVVFEPSTVKILEKNSKPVTRKELIEKQVKALKE
jgi:hypothetical protein